jgi:5-methylcytosine-specific restriction endonuclease McrA
MRVATAETREALLKAIGSGSQRSWAMAHGACVGSVNDCLLGKGVKVERENDIRIALGLPPYKGERIEESNHCSSEHISALTYDEIAQEINKLVDIINDARRTEADLIERLKKERKMTGKLKRDIAGIYNPKRRSSMSYYGYREFILQRDGRRCRYCGTELQGKNVHIDHVYPVAMGGIDHPDNLVASCKKCNTEKRDRVGVWPYPIGYFDNENDHA